MVDYAKELHYEDYNETQYIMNYKGFTFFWPKIIDVEWLTKWLLRESFAPDDSHDYLLLYKPAPDDVLYDMGASEGIFTKKVVQKGVKKIYAFDPLECFIESLNLLFKDEPMVETICIGFADRAYTDKYAEFPIKIVTLDSFMASHPDILPPTIIKMDLEGYDLAALRGGVETLKKYKPDLVLCKYHKPSDKNDFIEFLKPLGYTVRGETSDALIYFSAR